MDENWGQGSVNNNIGWGKAAASNNIYWGYSHYLSESGETNITGEGSAPTMERYLVYDCVYQQEYSTVEYISGTFQINDRVSFTSGNGNSFGTINSITDQENENLQIISLGVNSTNCYDNILNFISQTNYEGPNVGVDFFCNPSVSNFAYNRSIDSYITYSYYLNVYIEGINEDGDYYSNNITFDGASERLYDYNYLQGKNNFMFNVNSNIGGTIDYASIDYGYEQPYFNSIQSYSSNDYCSYNYFLQNATGYTYIANFQSGC
jgi:hypothetical protein